ncbi:tyrosine-type recombinase/integrase [Roseibium alexandrii]
MPREKLPPRLKLRDYRGSKVWVIKDGKRDVRTGCLEPDLAGAEAKLKAYLIQKHQPAATKDPEAIACADILTYYAVHKVPTISNARNEVYLIDALARFWGTKYLFDVDKPNCRAYASLRLSDGVTGGTARRELETLKAAVNFFLEEKKLSFKPSFQFPEKGDSRLRWLRRSEVAQFIHAARRRGNHHIARIILIGVYTGTRVGAIRQMRWVPSVDTGYFDLEHGVMYRKGHTERTTKKRRPSIGIPDRLMPHLHRWRDLDGPCPYVIHRDGIPMDSARKAWANSRDDAGLDADVVPHCLRHTTASWGIQNVETVQELQSLADFLGMSLKMLLETYGHLNPVHQRAASNAISRRPGHI